MEKTLTPAARKKLLAELTGIESRGGSGTLVLGRSKTLSVSSLDKVYFPDEGYTKGDLMRYYVRMAPLILPALADRPLVLKRYPDGIEGPSFYQQKAPDRAPEGVRIERVTTEGAERQPRVIGGDLTTLLYLVQLGTIAMDPWTARVRSLSTPDYAVLDLDPQPAATFQRVVQVARWIHQQLDGLGLRAVVKTSGSRGMHVVIPLPPGVTFDLATRMAEKIARTVATAHPREATTARSLKSRPEGAVYIDYLQNARGKSVSCVYSARARPGATVSTPLRWREVTAKLDPSAFTIATVPRRVAKAGDLWRDGMRGAGAIDLAAASAT